MQQDKNRILLNGLPFTGKSKYLMNQYIELLKENISSDRILVLLKDSRQVKKWREEITYPVLGAINVFTYWGFVRAEIIKFWDYIDKSAFQNLSQVRPFFINSEIAHYILTTLVDRARANDSFQLVTATSAHIALQIMRNLNLAAINTISIQELYNRLIRTNPDDLKKDTFKDALNVSEEFIKYCREANYIDYSMAVEIYNDQLFHYRAYQDNLASRFSAVIIDNLEEALPVEVDLLELLMKAPEIVYASYDPSGGHTRWMGADPTLVKERLFDYFKIEKPQQTPSCNPEVINLVPKLELNIKNFEGNEVYLKKFSADLVQRDFRSEMLEAVNEKLTFLLGKGCLAKDIAVVAPSIDLILKKSIEQILERYSIKPYIIGGGNRLVDQTYAQVIITLACLSDAELYRNVNRTYLSRTFANLLQLDPVRSTVLTEYCLKSGAFSLVELEPNIIARIGFNAAGKYEHLKKWLDDIRASKNQKEFNIFEKIFAGLLAPLINNKEQIIIARQVIDSSLRFKEAYDKKSNPSNPSYFAGFIDMVRKGTVAARVLLQPEPEEDGLVLSTPGALFNSNRIFKHQLWVDCSSAAWFPRDSRELSNPYIARRNWDGRWNDTLDQEIMFSNCLRMVGGLLYRCQDSVTMFQSEYNSLGQEMTGHVGEVVFNTVVSKK